MEKDNLYMEKAIELALKGKGKVSPNPLVGCVIVKNNKIISSGYHKKYGYNHAEVEATKGLNPSECNNADLYITLEPCNHHGNTPPCTELIKSLRFKRIIVGSLDSNPKVNGKGIEELKRFGFNVKVGVKNDEINKINEEYAKFIKSKIPFVSLKAAISLDGKIATKTGDSKWITSKKSREDAHKIRYFHDAVAVGVNTVINDNPRLDCRFHNKNKIPKRVIIDPDGKTPMGSYLIKTAKKYDTYVVIRSNLSSYKKNKFKKSGVKLIDIDALNKEFNLKEVLKKLGKEEIASVLVEGGGFLLGKAIEQNIADKIYLYIAPKVIGENGLSVFNTKSKDKVSKSYSFEKSSLEKIGPDVKYIAYPRR